jgi:hypothetical protein
MINRSSLGKSTYFRNRKRVLWKISACSIVQIFDSRIIRMLETHPTSLPCCRKFNRASFKKKIQILRFICAESCMETMWYCKHFFTTRIASFPFPSMRERATTRICNRNDKHLFVHRTVCLLRFPFLPSLLSLISHQSSMLVLLFLLLLLFSRMRRTALAKTSQYISN